MGRKISIISVYILLLAISSSVVSQNIAKDPDLSAAFVAQGSLQLDKSRILFKSVATNGNASKEDRSKALRELAIQDWKIYKNYSTAKEKLQQADSIGGYRSETWLKIARIEEESTHFIEARTAAKKSIELSVSNTDETYAKYKYAQVILKEAIHQINNEKTINEELVLEASGILQEILKVHPTHVNASYTLLGISLLLKDGDMAYKAWLSYFRFSDVESVHAYLKQPAIKLSNIFSNWSHRSLTDIEKIDLITAMSKSRFYSYAKILYHEFNFKKKNDKDIKGIVAYSNYIEDVKKFTNEYYRKTTINEGKVDEYLDGLSIRNEALYNQLIDLRIVKDTFNFRNFRDLIRKEFGSVIMVASTSSSSATGLILGHIVNERTRTIEQYGHQADFAFTELDMMVSNGYPSWFWEDRGAGGFALPGGFLRIKTMFKHLGINAWEKITDSVKRSKIEKNIHNNLLLSTSTSDVNTVLTALSKKLEQDALGALYAKLIARGYKGIDLQLKFIEQYDLYRDNATMFAHEGRHSLDRVVLGDTYRELGSAVIEYRGRLSQIAFSESPKLELANMVSGIGTTGAGQANQMIVDTFVRFIQENKAHINDFDKTKRVVSQIYKLTDEQIKSCARNVDPFYIDYTNK